MHPTARQWLSPNVVTLKAVPKVLMLNYLVAWKIDWGKMKVCEIRLPNYTVVYASSRTKGESGK
jgi:hypothetical protein